MNRRDPARLFHRLRHTRIENKGLKALSLLLAVLLFIVSRQPVIDLQLVGVPIEYRGLSPGVKIVGDPEQTVSLRLSGPRDIVRSLTPNQLLVIADLSGKEPGERVVQLRVDEGFLPDNVKVMQIEPPSIRIKLEPNVTKRVKVEAQFTGKVVEDREIYGVELYPREVEVFGPKSAVEALRAMRVEVKIASLPPDVTSVTPQVQLPANIEIGKIIPREVKVKR
jgi:YbbR domain-containing protein